METLPIANKEVCVLKMKDSSAAFLRKTFTVNKEQIIIDGELLMNGKLDSGRLIWYKDWGAAVILFDGSEVDVEHII